MKRNLPALLLVFIFLFYWVSVPVVFAAEPDKPGQGTGFGNTAADNDDANKTTVSEGIEPTVTIGGSAPSSVPVKDDDLGVGNQAGVIESASVLGDFNRSARGIDYFRDITISLVGDNLNDDNFLSPEGLHWSARSRVELIKGRELGDFDFSVFPNDVPKARVKAFRINDGDSGRITYVGRTRSGIDLDLIWTVTGSDKEDWAAHSGYANSKVKGLGFTGEQFFPGARGNSIAVLYDNASNLGLRYQIVKHGTFVEQPVVVTFISTDIDSAQGVETDLANLVEVIPPDSHLVKKDGIIYDTTRGAVNLNGSAALPRGGYLGAGFLSNFNYVFYSPAPQRVNNSYHYPKAVRYDIFGSSLQAKITPRLRQHISVSYVDTSGRQLKPEERFKGYTGESYSFSAPGIDKYQLAAVEKDVSDIYRPRVRFIYSPIKASSSRQVGNPGSHPTYSKHSSSAVAGRKSVARSPQIKREARRFPAPKPPSKALPANREPMRTHGKVANNSATQGARDPFLINTGMTAAEKRLFLNYVEEASRQASQKYPKDIRKRYHFIANAIAYPVYHENKLQSRVNDFGAHPEVGNYEKISSTLNDNHYYSRFIVDFPHFATTLASAEKSSPNKETLKFIAGLSPSIFLGVSPRDNFFQLNSLTGDKLTNIDSKDRNTDIDAIIFHYHPDFKNLPLDEAIVKYYHTKNLAAERERLYREVLKKQAGSHLSPQEQEKLNIFLAALTLGGVALAGMSLRERAERQLKLFKENPKKYLRKLAAGFNARVRAFMGDPLGAVGSKLLGPSANLLADYLVMGSILFKKTTGVIGDSLVKPVARQINRFIVKPLSKYVVAPIYRHVVKPIWSFTEKHILKPVVRKVIKPVVRAVKKIITPLYKRVIKPAVRYIKNKIVKPLVKNIKRRIIKPIYRRVIKPLYRKLVKPIYRRIVKPVYKKIIKPVYNKLIKPVIKPMYQKIIKPVSSFVKKQIVKPVKSFIKNKILKPAARFFKRLWG